jgi:beta-lactamase regulating signal transducer with metallopeptidase domain
MPMSSQPYLAHGVTLALVWFLAVNVATSIAAAAIARRFARQDDRSPAFWLMLRLLPAIVSTAFVAVLFVPSYWEYEPREFVEGFDLTLAAIGVAALAVIAAGALRGVRAWTSAIRRTSNWMRHARPVTLESTLPAYAIETSQPLMALAGVLRPRLLVTRGLVDALTASELAASVAHEVGHQRAFDNLKRLLMCAAPDCLPRTAARAIEQRWAAAAERAADYRATNANSVDRCALASALVKVARLMPAAPVPAAEPISLLVADADIASRVRVLLSDTEPPRRGARAVRWVAVALVLASLALAYMPLVRAVHAATEVLVHAI